MKFAQKNIETYFEENKKYGYKRLSEEKLTADLSKEVQLEIGQKAYNTNPEGKVVHLTKETFQDVIFKYILYKKKYLNFNNIY